jgi:hypothetical protein
MTYAVLISVIRSFIACGWPGAIIIIIIIIIIIGGAGGDMICTALFMFCLAYCSVQILFVQECWQVLSPTYFPTYFVLWWEYYVWC